MVPRIYISGPFSKGDQIANVNRACEVWETLRRGGVHPVCPHWSLTQQLVKPIGWQEWIDFDLREVATCDVVLRLPGESEGADAECGHAKSLGIPVVNDYSELAEAVYRVKREKLHVGRTVYFILDGKVYAGTIDAVGPAKLMVGPYGMDRDEAFLTFGDAANALTKPTTPTPAEPDRSWQVLSNGSIRLCGVSGCQKHSTYEEAREKAKPDGQGPYVWLASENRWRSYYDEDIDATIIDDLEPTRSKNGLAWYYAPKAVTK